MYARESFTDAERSILSRFFTNDDLPVFALINLPEIVKGALFARYSRTHMSLRRLFLAEFYEQPDVGVAAIADQLDDASPQGERRAEQLYERVFVDYGDDSVAQLGAAHLACEQASAILTKFLERGRLAAYLEQSTRYIYFDEKLQSADGDARYRYQIPPEIADGPLNERYQQAMDSLFECYSLVVHSLNDYFFARFPRKRNQSPTAYRRAIRARACDTARGLLPASTLSNVGIFATGQAYEAMLLRMNASPLAEAREYSQMMLGELRKVIGGFLSRVDVEDRGIAWSDYFSSVAKEMDAFIGEDEIDSERKSDFDIKRDEVRLIDWDRGAEIKVVAAALYPYSSLSEKSLLERVREMSIEERTQVIATYIGQRNNRRHKPGRGMERIYYRFDILSDFGSFRDLQRHRMMTIDWQKLTPRYGYATPPEIGDVAGDVASSRWRETMDEMAVLYEDVLAAHGADVAQYVVPFGYRIRYNIQMNARQAFHLLELRTGESGHTDYRRICLKMHRLIRDRARHRSIADGMNYIDAKSYGLGRMSSEMRQTERRQLQFDLS